MNIFVLSDIPESAARYHNDRHVAKMLLESAQILCTAHVFLDGERTALARVPLVLRPTHVNHPCAIWARQASGNYHWLGDLLLHLAEQYQLRYGRAHQYEANGLLATLTGRQPLNLPAGERSPWAQCMPRQYMRPDAVQAYRLYYFHEKRHIAQWSVVGKPHWWTELEENSGAHV